MYLFFGKKYLKLSAALLGELFSWSQRGAVLAQQSDELSGCFPLRFLAIHVLFQRKG